MALRPPDRVGPYSPTSGDSNHRVGGLGAVAYHGTQVYHGATTPRSAAARSLAATNQRGRPLFPRRASAALSHARRAQPVRLHAVTPGVAHDSNVGGYIFLAVH